MKNCNRRKIRMDITDFASPDGLGLCASMATMDADGNPDEEVVLSQQFNDGVLGVRKAVDMVVEASAAGGTIPYRYGLILTMVEAEVRWGAGTNDMRVTGTNGGAITSIKRELGMRRQMPRRFAAVVLEGVLNLARLQIRHNAMQTDDLPDEG